MQRGKVAIATTVRSPERFGCISFDRDEIAGFFGKPEIREDLINGGYFGQRQSISGRDRCSTVSDTT